jgi:hypothetical protein
MAETLLCPTSTIQRADGEDIEAIARVSLGRTRHAPITEVSCPKIGPVKKQSGAMRTGDHRPGGLIPARGPSNTPGLLRREVSVTDLSPTIAAVLDDSSPV